VWDGTDDIAYGLMKRPWNFEFRETQKDRMKISQKIKLIFLISTMFELPSAKVAFSRYSRKCKIQGVSEVVCNKKFEHLHSVSIKWANFFSVIEGSSKFFS